MRRRSRRSKKRCALNGRSKQNHNAVLLKCAAPGKGDDEISARVRIPDDLTGLLQGEWEQIIAQAGYSEQDAEIVRRYVMDKTPQIDVAVELDMARSTITRRLPQIYARARHTAAKLQMINE